MSYFERPDAHNDPNNDWSFEYRIYDSSYSTSSSSVDPGWTGFVELFFENTQDDLVGLFCTKIEFKVATQYNTSRSVDIDVRIDGVWTGVYSGIFTQYAITEKSLSTPAIIDAIRVRLYRSSGWKRIYMIRAYVETTESELSQVSTKNNIVCLKMNDNAGNFDVIDSGPWANHGTSLIRMTSLMSTAGKVNTALNFNGADSIQVPPLIKGDKNILDPYGQFSAVHWFKMTAANNRKYFLEHAEGDRKYRVQTGINDREIGAYVDTAAGSGNVWYDGHANNCLLDDYWRMVVVTFDRTLAAGKRLKMYVDLLYCDSGADHDSDILTSEEELTLGGNDASTWLTGDMDIVMLFNKALTHKEIAWLWNDGDGRETLIQPHKLCLASIDSEPLLSSSFSREELLQSSFASEELLACNLSRQALLTVPLTSQTNLGVTKIETEICS